MTFDRTLKLYVEREMKSDDLPRIPEQYIERPERKLGDLKAGERAVLHAMFAVHVDEQHRVWVDGNQPVAKSNPLPGLSVQVERTEEGFILWLDNRTTFRPDTLPSSKSWIPVVEFRDAPKKNNK